MWDYRGMAAGKRKVQAPAGRYCWWSTTANDMLLLSKAGGWATSGLRPLSDIVVELNANGMARRSISSPMHKAWDERSTTGKKMGWV